MTGKGNRKATCVVCLMIAAAMLISPTLYAGMPSPIDFSLTDFGATRIHAISFFAMMFLLVSFIFKLLWNSLRKDFPAMPQLTFRKAMIFVAIWAAAFTLILTMIAGARELMTPGAWKKAGHIYELNEKR
ncbi:MAG TPA: hypothetical protein DCZ94_11690 [Lentisphaeria bacterium]|nr:MAG: hypothetical protein A2X48_00480 [Lentisphaerae bacterium GWF2_49_21]HBC87609.1 hypothetical protein [Lentisphaeria bacterium]